MALQWLRLADPAQIPLHTKPRRDEYTNLLRLHPPPTIPFCVVLISPTSLKEACDRTPKENETRLPASSSSGGVAGPAVAGSTRSRVYMPLEDDSGVSAALAQTSIEPAARTALRLKSVTPVPLATSPVPAKAMPPELTNCPNFVTETGAAIVVISARHPSCDACMGCDDVCEFAICTECNTTRDRIRLRKCQTRAFTMCEIARGSTRDHALLTANKLVYDIGDYIKSGRHPGGERSLMKKLGTDVTRDFAMHSKAGKRMWKSLLIGKLVPCPKALCNQKKTPWKLGMW
jgi:cytochrome b involved in lipid metabolism